MNERETQRVDTHDDVRREVHLDEHGTDHAGARPAEWSPDAPVTVDRARGGFSIGSILSGVLVAIGAFIVLSAIIGAILASTGVADGGISANEARDATLGAGIGLIVAQFLAYLWGGYTAGRMARGSGVLNGILVAIVALVFVAALGAIVAAVAGGTDIQAPSTAQLPLPLSTLSDIGTGVGIGILVAMLLGGALGGAMGQRWHTKLENAETEAIR